MIDINTVLELFLLSSLIKTFGNGSIGAKSMNTVRNVPINKFLWMYEVTTDLCQGYQLGLAVNINLEVFI